VRLLSGASKELAHAGLPRRVRPAKIIKQSDCTLGQRRGRRVQAAHRLN
jgi:hypothetical protein